MAKYDLLGRYLSRRAGAEIELSFAEIERIIGAMLPNSASRPQWWANENDPQSRHVQSRAWRDAGYDAYPLVARERVRFARRASPGSSGGPGASSG